MALVADFMLVWLPAPTVSLRPPVALSGGLIISKFFYSCPDNAFQVINPLDIIYLVFYVNHTYPLSYPQNPQNADSFGRNTLFIFAENGCNSGNCLQIVLNQIPAHFINLHV